MNLDAYPNVPVKYPYVGNLRWAFMKWADIPYARDHSRTYLRRLRIFQTPWFALYLHFIYLPDDDRHPHDHPCNFWAFIVRGGYIEKVYKNVARHDFTPSTSKWRRFSLHVMRIAWAHQIVSLVPGTITLCWFGPRRQQWGFWTSAGRIDHDDYNREQQDAAPGSVSDPFGS